MPRVQSKQVWLSLLVAALFAPIFLATGSAAFRPAWLDRALAGIPVFQLMVIGLVVLFTVLVWIFSSFAFGDADEGSDKR